MKKKIREITVDDVKYNWRVVGTLTVWKSKNEILFRTLIPENQVITPKDVKSYIQVFIMTE